MISVANDEPSSLLELSIECKNLADLDILSKSDPMVVLFTSENGVWKEVGRTEMQKDNLNPKFVQKIHMKYFFERIQSLRFCVYDIDSSSKNLGKQDFIGEASCNLSDIVTMRNSTLSLLLKSPTSQSRGTIIITAEEVQGMNTQVVIKFSGEHLDKKDLFGKSDPYLIVSRLREDGSYTPVLKTPHILKTLNPSWPTMTIPTQTICNGNLMAPLRIECFDWNKSSKHSLIGTIFTNLNELTTSQGASFALINEKKKNKKKGYQNSGLIKIDVCKMERIYSFLDYVRGGCEMKLLVAIDFTASNGDFNKRNSLHYIGDPNNPNDYLKAIRHVGDILCPYDATKYITTLGFGAKVGGVVRHCINMLSPDGTTPYGVEGVLQAYHNHIRNLQFFGPTNFSEIINFSINYVKELSINGEKQAYGILLILTDGVISDLQNTIDKIVEASELPLSIVIVGIGNDSFDSMDVLDADDNPLVSTRGVVMKRDIVQFVPFNKFKNDLARLAGAVLEELPQQVVQYFKSKGTAPNPPNVGINQVFQQQEIVHTTAPQLSQGFSIFQNQPNINTGQIQPLQGFPKYQ